jgi:hypothetical protein
MTVPKTKSSNPAVNRLRTVLLAEPTEIPGGQNSHFLTAYLKDLEPAKLTQSLCEWLLIWDALEEFAENQIGHPEALPTKLAIKVVCFTVDVPNDYHLRSSSTARLVEVSLPYDLASKSTDTGLSLNLNEQP